MNLKRLVMFKLFQEVSGLQRSCLTFSVASLDFVTDEVPEQTVVSPFFIRRLKIFCPRAGCSDQKVPSIARVAAAAFGFLTLSATRRLLGDGRTAGLDESGRRVSWPAA